MESILIALGNKYTLRSIERSIYAHSFAESKPEQRYGHSVLPGPLGKTFFLSAIFNNPLPVFVSSISCIWFCCKRLFDRPAIPKSPRKIACIKSADCVEANRD